MYTHTQRYGKGVLLNIRDSEKMKRLYIYGWKQKEKGR
jgi:hypothetical protein